MKLVNNWKKWPRMFVMQAIVVVTGLQSVLLLMPETWAARPAPLLDGVTWADVLATLSIAVAVLGGVGRLIDQGIVTKADPWTSTQHLSD